MPFPISANFNFDEGPQKVGGYWYIVRDMHEWLRGPFASLAEANRYLVEHYPERLAVPEPTPKPKPKSESGTVPKPKPKSEPKPKPPPGPTLV